MTMYLGEYLANCRTATKPAFVELIAPERAQIEECVIALESSPQRCSEPDRRTTRGENRLDQAGMNPAHRL